MREKSTKRTEWHRTDKRQADCNLFTIHNRSEPVTGQHHRSGEVFYTSPLGHSLKLLRDQEKNEYTSIYNDRREFFVL